MIHEFDQTIGRFGQKTMGKLPHDHAFPLDFVVLHLMQTGEVMG